MLSVQLRVAVSVLRTLKNWPLYLLDKAGLLRGEYVLRTNDLQFLVRAGTIDKWVVVENVCLDQYHLAQFRGQHFDTVVDLGANIGVFTLQAARTFPAARLIAFEPNPQPRRMLERNLQLNRLEGRVEVRAAAVTGRHIAQVPFFLGEQDHVGSTAFPSGSVISVPNVHVRELCQLVRGRALLKMDIEGEENALLRGYLEELRTAFAVIVLERHSIEKGFVGSPPRPHVVIAAHGVEVIEGPQRTFYPSWLPNMRLERSWAGAASLPADVAAAGVALSDGDFTQKSRAARSGTR